MVKHWFTAYLTSHYSSGKILGLDLGSGYNNWKEFFNCKWIGLDLSKRINSQNEQISTIFASAESISFSDNSFDFLSCYSVLLYVKDLISVIQEIHRVLKPNGVAVIIIQNTRGQKNEESSNFLNKLNQKLLDELLKLNNFKSIKHRNFTILLFSMYYNFTSVYAYAIVTPIKEIKNE